MLKRFLLPLPCALLISFVIWEVRWAISDGLGTASRLALPTAMLGGTSFPIGLAIPWCSPRGVLHNMWPWVSIAGYVLYLALSLIASKRRSFKIGAVLILLLAFNVISCQVNDAAIQKAIGLE